MMNATDSVPLGIPIATTALYRGFVFLLCGLIGSWGFEQARISHAYQSERMGKILDEHREHGDYSRTLRRFEVTVSQAVHDASAPHGVIFRAVFLCLALLHLHAGMSMHELYPLWELPPSAGTEVLTVLNAVRSVVAPTACVLIVFIPTGKPLVQLRERMALPTYAPTYARATFQPCLLPWCLNVVPRGWRYEPIQRGS